MPKISLMTPELNSAVIRPAILDITKQIQELTGIPKDSRILYVGEIGASYQKGSTLSDSPNERDRTGLSFGNQVSIEIDNDYNEANVNSTAVRQPEHIPVFNDDKLGILIKPVYSKNDFTITFKYRSESETAGLRWRDSIRMHISMMRDINLHTVKYHFMIPPEYIYILKELHRLRENVAGYNEDFDTYLAAHATTKFTAISNQSGSHVRLAIADTQMRIEGLFDFQIAPAKGERDDRNGSAWTTSFTYKVSFDVPIASNMEYPIMIHNQLLEYPYLDYEESYDLDKHNKSWTQSLGYLSGFEATNELDKVIKRSTVVRVPHFDAFVPTSSVFASQPVLSALCNVDTATPRLLLNLKELGDVGIDTDVLEMFSEEYPYLTKPYKSIFHLSLFKWSALSSDKHISVDSALNVICSEDLSLRDNHRVVLSMITDISLLDKPALLRLKKYRKAGRKALLAIGVSRGQLKLLEQKCNLLSLVPELPDTGNSIAELRNSYIQFNTVQSSFVISSNDKDRLKSHIPDHR